MTLLRLSKRMPDRTGVRSGTEYLRLCPSGQWYENGAGPRAVVCRGRRVAIRGEFAEAACSCRGVEVRWRPAAALGRVARPYSPARPGSTSNGDQLAVLAPDHAQAVADLTDRGVGPDSLDDGRHQVLLASCTCFEPVHGRLPGRGVAIGPDLLYALALAALPFRIDLLERRSRGLLVAVFVDADDDLGSVFHRSLDLIRRFLDLALLVAGLDRRERTAQGFDFFEVVVRGRLQLISEGLDVVAAGQRVRRLGHARFVGKDLLRPERETGRLCGRQRQRFVS